MDRDRVRTREEWAKWLEGVAERAGTLDFLGTADELLSAIDSARREEREKVAKVFDAHANLFRGMADGLRDPKPSPSATGEREQGGIEGRCATCYEPIHRDNGVIENQRFVHSYCATRASNPSPSQAGWGEPCKHPVILTSYPGKCRDCGKEFP